MEIETSKDLIHLKNKMRGCQTVEGVIAVAEAYDAAQSVELKNEVARLHQIINAVTKERDDLNLRAIDLSTALEGRDSHILSIHERIEQWRVWAVALVGTTYLDANDDECLQRLLMEALKGNPFDELVFDIDDSKSREKNLEKPMAALLDAKITTPVKRLQWVREYRRILSNGYLAKVRLLKEQVKAAKDFPDSERKKMAKKMDSLLGELDVAKKEGKKLLMAVEDWRLWADSFMHDISLGDVDLRAGMTTLLGVRFNEFGDVVPAPELLTESVQLFSAVERKKLVKYENKVDELAKSLNDWHQWADGLLDQEPTDDTERRDELDEILSKAQSEAATNRNNWELTVKRVQSWHVWADGFLGVQPVSDEERHASMYKLFKRWQQKAKANIVPKLSDDEQLTVQRAVEHLESRAEDLLTEASKADGVALNTVVEQDILDTYFPGVVAIIERVWPGIVTPKLMDDAQLLKFLKNSERDSSYLLQRVVAALSSRVAGGVDGQANHHP